MDRRRFVSGTSLGLVAASVGMTGVARASAARSAEAIVSLTEVAAATADAVRPFHVNIPEEKLADLRRRINATNWPERETVGDDSQGVPLATMQQLARHWATDYDWRKVESRLNALPQFVTNIDGLDIHFIHVRSKHENALPIIVSHGWPGSILEQIGLIEPLTDPTAHGGTAADAFHVVIPSIPGYGFSDRPATNDFGPVGTARAWTTLMKRLGYTHFVAQGGDIGSVVTNAMGAQAPPELLGVHVNLVLTTPPEISKLLALGQPPPDSFSPEEKTAYAALMDFQRGHFAYAIEMSTRPQTLYGLADSPVALAAWIFDHGDGWGQPAGTMTSAVAGRTINGHSAGAVTRDDVLDNITLYWLTTTGVSAARMYWSNARTPPNAGVSIPAAVTAFPGELFVVPRSWAEYTYHKLVYYNKADKGGHFAAWEQPQLFSEELRAAFRPMRPSA